MLGLFTTARRRDAVVFFVTTLVVLAVFLPHEASAPRMAARLAAAAPGIAAKFGAAQAFVEKINSTDFGWPDCAPFAYPGCAEPTYAADGSLVSPAACVRCTQKTAAGKIRVACVGDSITAGVRAISPADTYPSMLQTLLGDAYIVTNLGSSGATMLNDGARPFVKTAMYRALLKDEYDIIVLMLGTNDARSPAGIKDCKRLGNDIAYENIPCLGSFLPPSWKDGSEAQYALDAEDMCVLGSRCWPRGDATPSCF